MIFVHIGAGAGDLDAGANFRDGFSEFVKNHNIKEKEIFAVEANPKNIDKLKECWSKYKNVKIFNFAICPNDYSEKEIEFFYCEDDSPHYQTMSFDIKHVKKHFPKSKNIKSINIKAKKLADFMYENFLNKKIDFFSIDIEGLDYQILTELNLKEYDIGNISFEYLHLKFHEKVKIFYKFLCNGYSYNGFGIDHNNFDFTFKKKINVINIFFSFILLIIPKKYYRFLNKFIFKI